MRALPQPAVFVVSATLMVALLPLSPASGGMPAPRGAVDWPQARFSPVHQGVNPFETILSPSTVGGLHQVWAHQVTGKVLYGAPTVVDGVVYLGTFAAVLYAFDASTGALVWSTRVDGGLEDAPAVVDGIVYVHSDGGTVYALDASTGTVIWTATPGHAVSPVTVTNGIVYVNGYFQLVALDAASGAELWTAPLHSLTTSAPTVAVGRVFVADESGAVQAIDATNGAVLWVRRPGRGEAFQLSTPAAAEGSVFVGSAHRDAVYRLDAGTGDVMWTAKLQGIMDSSPAIADGVVYIGGYLNTYALDSRTGAIIWKARHVTTTGLGATYANGVVYVASDRLYALDAATGTGLWSQSFGPQFSYSSPVVVNGMVFVGSDSVSGPGFLYAFGL